MKNSTKDLHDNFILIHQFLYPEDTLKEWVRNDLQYTGHYHDDWNEIMTMVIRLGSDYDWKILETLDFLERTYFPDGLNTQEKFYLACVSEIKRRA